MADNRIHATNYRDDVAALQELKWRAAALEGYNISQLLGDSDTSPLKVRFGKNVPEGAVTPYSLSVIKALMLLSGVRSLLIGSAYRSPEDQARVMFNNLQHGKRVRYAAPGRAVTRKYDEAHKAGLSPGETKALMVHEIYRLGPEKVSKHAAPPGWLNVVDIGPSSINARHRRRFVSATERLVGSYIRKFLHPGNSKDPAYHIEIPQGMLLVMQNREMSL